MLFQTALKNLNRQRDNSSKRSRFVDSSFILKNFCFIMQLSCIKEATEMKNDQMKEQEIMVRESLKRIKKMVNGGFLGHLSRGDSGTARKKGFFIDNCADFCTRG